jgi:hypothetical protein
MALVKTSKIAAATAKSRQPTTTVEPAAPAVKDNGNRAHMPPRRAGATARVGVATPPWSAKPQAQPPIVVKPKNKPAGAARRKSARVGARDEKASERIAAA